MLNTGCSALFKNVNNGIDDLIVAKRLTSWAVFGVQESIAAAIEQFKTVDDKKKELKRATFEGTIKEKNELVMSKIHSNVSNCQFSLFNADCQINESLYNAHSFYREHFYLSIKEEEEKFIKANKKYEPATSD